MGSRGSQKDHVRNLLKDAILMLCQKGLENSPTFSVEALIGITLEDGDVMLLSINESIADSDHFTDDQLSQLGAALGRVPPPLNCNELDEDPTPNWPSKRRLFTKSKLFKSKRKRGRPRKVTLAATAIGSVKNQLPPDEECVESVKECQQMSEDDQADVEHLQLVKLEEATECDSSERGEDEGKTHGNPNEDGQNATEMKVKESPIYTIQGQGADVAVVLDAEIPQVGPYKCSMCSAVYKYRKCLIEHQLKLHQPKEEEEVVSTFPCDMCEKVFSTKRSLTRHVVVHSPDREKFPCEVCQKSFSCQRHVEFHIRTVHKGMYPYMCDLCGKQVTTKSSLAGHMASKHSMDRIKCSKCDRQYSSHTTFIKHVCVEKPKKLEETVCTICNKSFDQPKRLVQHMSKHNEPRLQCETCGRSFKWASSLQAHKVAAHKLGEGQVQNQSQEHSQQHSHGQPTAPSTSTEQSREHDTGTSLDSTSRKSGMDLLIEPSPGSSYSLPEGGRAFYTLPYGGVQQMPPVPTTGADMALPPQGWTGEPVPFYVNVPNTHNPAGTPGMGP